MTDAENPEVPHANLIEARVRFTTTPCARCGGWEQHVYVTGYMTDDGLVTSEVSGLTNSNHQRGCALGDTVPREQHEQMRADRFSEGWTAAHAHFTSQITTAERERDEARALHDAEVWEQAAEFVDEQREDFDGDLRQVRDRIKSRAAAIREEAQE